MLRCYLCGRSVPPEEAIRRDVRTGEVGGLAVTGRVDLCPHCDASEGRADRRRLWLLLGAAGVAIALFLVAIIQGAFH